MAFAFEGTEDERVRVERPPKTGQVRLGIAASRIGPIEVGVMEGRLIWLRPSHPFLPKRGRSLGDAFPGLGIERDDAGIAPIAARALAYAAGTLDLPPPLTLFGTAFEGEIWRALMDIPLGARVSYGELANALGRPRAARAAGRACGRNPIALVVPCHRVVAADGLLGGYAWGLTIKQILLDLEGHKADQASAIAATPAPLQATPRDGLSSPSTSRIV